MRKMLLAILALTLVTACTDGGEDFTIEVAGSAADNAATLAGIDLAQAAAALPGLEIATARSGENAITWTMPVVDYPGHRAGDAVIALRLEPVPDKRSTTIHARLDVPATRVLMGEANQALSEDKIAAALKLALSGSDKARAVREVLTGVAIGSNSDLQAQLNGAMLPGGASRRNEGPMPEADAGSSDWGSAAGYSDPDDAGSDAAFPEDEV